MPTYLLVLITILVCLGIIACVYGIIAFRRVAVAYKKIDYLVEDLTYKSELLAPAVETVSRWAKYGDSIEDATRKNSRSILDFLTKNRSGIEKIATDIKKTAKEATTHGKSRRN